MRHRQMSIQKIIDRGMTVQPSPPTHLTQPTTTSLLRLLPRRRPGSHRLPDIPRPKQAGLIPSLDTVGDGYNCDDGIVPV